MARAVILHGSWVEDERGGGFVFWGERAYEQFELPAGDDRFPLFPAALGAERQNYGYSYGYNRHGYSYGHYEPAPPKELTRLIAWGLAEHEMGLYAPGKHRQVQVYAALPDGECHIAGWRVDGLMVNAGDALTVLNRIACLPLPAAGTTLLDSCPLYDESRTETKFDHIGPDLLFWATTARLGREILASGRYIPGVALDGDSWRGQWQAATDDPAVATRVVRLIAACHPPAVRWSPMSRSYSRS